MRLRSSRIAMVGAATLLAACAAACSSGGGGGGGGSSAVLTISGTAENSVTKNFNPYSATNPVDVLGVDSLIYEPLLQFDDVEPGIQPWLATRYSWADEIGRAHV